MYPNLPIYGQPFGIPFDSYAQPSGSLYPSAPGLQPVYVHSNPPSSAVSPRPALSTGSAAAVPVSHPTTVGNENEPTFQERCLGLINNSWYSQLHNLPTIKASLDRLKTSQTQATNGAVPKFFSVLANVSDFVAKIALKCALFSLLILSAAVFIAWPLSAFSILTLLPVAMGWAFVGMMAQMIATLANRLKEATIYYHFSSLLSPLDKARLGDIKKWDQFTQTNQKHFADVEKHLNKLVKDFETVPQEGREQLLTTIMEQMRKDVVCINEFKSVKTSLKLEKDLSLTRRYLGIA